MLAQGAVSTGEAAVVVQFDDEHYVVRRLPVAEGAATGQDLLLDSGLDVTMQQYGAGGIVCKIAHKGCDYPSNPCFCAMPDWWHYQHWIDDAWDVSGTGAAGWPVSPGMIDGWVWASGYGMIEITPEAVFDANRLAPSAPFVEASSQGLTVVVETQGDQNGDAHLSCQLQIGSGFASEILLVQQIGGEYLGWLAGPLPGGSFEVALSYDDPDGVNGSDIWRTGGWIDVEQPERVFLPLCIGQGG